MTVEITLYRVKVDGHGYDHYGAYYGRGQSGHSWTVTAPGFRAEGHVCGRDGRKTRVAALREARLLAATARQEAPTD